MSDPGPLTIAEMSESSGLSPDTLRWYEREGLLPRVGRSASGHRRYGAREQGLLALLVALRETRMSTAGMRRFVELMDEGAASHGRRIALLEEGRARLAERRRQLDRAEAALERKILHYERLISDGLDCDGAPVPAETRALQLARG
ncbi:MerR family transcriptional regulator [Leucobacter weissii]|uniref:MerR family transcriptional regulator n=1 Tax=Leucobacter weissii TaxID=1983706 RepID=A0A939SAF9_9MICO|nr:MerR family transcriptional regulator [Leucobacter weissii]MBO1900373.1 MerR family transcriptional regulator [Leucobacter weissii]